MRAGKRAWDPSRCLLGKNVEAGLVPPTSTTYTQEACSAAVPANHPPVHPGGWSA